MTAQTSPIEVWLKPREEKRILGGHPWIFSNEIGQIRGEPEAGSLALAKSSQGSLVGLGFYNPHSLIAFRLLSRNPVEVDADFFRERLVKAWEYRKRSYPGSNSFRLCFGESDGLPGLVVDKYGEYLAVQIYSAGMERLIPGIQKALVSLLSPKGIYLRNDHPGRILEALPQERRLLYGEVPSPVEIEVDGVRFLVSIPEGQKTGFYFDQRDNRECLAPYFKGRRVLDLFCYSGAFALSAAQAGADRVLGVESSELAVELAEQSAVLNGLQSCCGFEVGRAEEVMDSILLGKGNLDPDFILLDPPSYVPSKKHIPKALKAYVRLFAQGLRCLPSGGYLAASTCSHHICREDFLAILRQSAAKSGKLVRIVELGSQAKDHPILLSMPETEYLHFALLEIV